MKKSMIIIIGVVIAVALLAGDFYGGMAYARYQNTRARAAFLGGRGFGNGTNGTTGNNSGFGGTITGQVKSLNGNTLVIATARNDQTINLDTTTTVEKSVSGATSDLQTGDRVIVMGTRSTTGAMTATQVLIIAAP